MKPPQHSLDAKPVYILPDDPAWDHDRIERELEEGDGDHPVLDYLGGAGRFDVHAASTYRDQQSTAAEYLTGEPVRFYLRRLNVHQMAEVQDLFVREFRDHDEPGLFKVWALCVKYGVAGVDGLEYRERGGVMLDSTLQAIYDEHGGLQTITRIGTAIWTLSQPLRADEKKA